jgi:hypothetical protein
MSSPAPQVAHIQATEYALIPTLITPNPDHANHERGIESPSGERTSEIRQRGGHEKPARLDSWNVQFGATAAGILLTQEHPARQAYHLKTPGDFHLSSDSLEPLNPGGLCHRTPRTAADILVQQPSGVFRGRAARWHG